jgi:hypothetical protein
MDKRSVLVVSLLSLFLLFSFRGYAEPMWSNPKNITPSNYDPNFVSTFNVTWTNDANTVLITIFNSITGYILVNNTSMGTTYGNNIYNYSIILPAGTFNWTSYANNTTDNWNTSDTWSFSIGQTPTLTRLFLDPIEDNKSYNSTNTANFTVTLNVTGKTVNLDSNYTGWTLQTGPATLMNYTSLSAVGNFWNITGYFSGDENYSASSRTYYFNVTDSTIPSYSYNVVSTNIAGSSAIFSTLWADNAGLSGYIFSFDNGNGSFVDYPWTPMTGLTNWSNITATINSTAGSTIRWKIYANDTSNNSNVMSTSFINKYSDGSTCTNNNQCLNFYCVNGVCRSSSPWCGDIHCDSGETCSSCLTDCGACTSTTTPSGPSGSTPSTGNFTIKNLPSILTAITGQSTSTSFTLSNTLQNNLANVSISVSGINSSWYTLSKNFISNLVHGSTQSITITFNIPNNAEAKDYNVAITAAGKDILTKLLKTYTATMKLTVNSSQPQPIQPLPSVTVSPQETEQQNETANITSNQTVSGATGLAATFEFFKNNLVIILAIAACLLIFIFRNNLTTALTGTLGKEEAETHKAKTASPLKGIKDKFNYKLIVNLKKESKAKNLKEPTEVQGAEKVPEMVPEKEPKRPAVLEKEIKRDIKELQSILDAENKVKKNKKKFNLGNN